MIGLKYFFIYDNLYQSVLNASQDDDDGASFSDDPSGVLPYFYPTYTPTDTKVFLTGQIVGALQIAAVLASSRVRRLSLVNEEVLVWRFPRCLMVLCYEGALPVETLEMHFHPLVESAAYFYLYQVVNRSASTPPPSAKTLPELDLGYYDLPSAPFDTHQVSENVFIPAIYSTSPTEEEVVEATSVLETIQPLRLSDEDKQAVDGFVFTVANLLQNLCSTLRPEMTLLNLSRSGNDVFVESQELLSRMRKDFGANGGALFFSKRLVTSTLGVGITKLVALVDLSALVPAEVCVAPGKSAGNRLGVYRVHVRKESVGEDCVVEHQQSENTTAEKSPEKLSAATLRAMSKNGSLTTNYWRLLKRVEKRRIKQASRKRDEGQGGTNLTRNEDLGSFEDIPLSAAYCDNLDDEAEGKDVEVDDEDESAADSCDEDDNEYKPAFMITYRVEDMESFFLCERVPENLTRMAEVLHKALGNLEGSIWCRVKMTATGNGLKSNKFGWFQWDRQWGSAIQDGKIAADQRDALQLVNHQLSLQPCDFEDWHSEDDDDVIQELLCRSGQDMIYGRRSHSRDLFYWSECPVLQTGAPSTTSALAEFPERARKHLKRLIL